MQTLLVFSPWSLFASLASEALYAIVSWSARTLVILSCPYLGRWMWYRSTWFTPIRIDRIVRVIHNGFWWFECWIVRTNNFLWIVCHDGYPFKSFWSSLFSISVPFCWISFNPMSTSRAFSITCSSFQSCTAFIWRYSARLFDASISSVTCTSSSLGSPGVFAHARLSTGGQKSDPSCRLSF